MAKIADPVSASLLPGHLSDKHSHLWYLPCKYPSKMKRAGLMLHCHLGIGITSIVLSLSFFSRDGAWAVQVQAGDRTPRVVSPPLSRRLVAYIFHPSEPFAISSQSRRLAMNTLSASTSEIASDALTNDAVSFHYIYVIPCIMICERI